jgi:DNA-binding FadR family transcriptional regulator
MVDVTDNIPPRTEKRSEAVARAIAKDISVRKLAPGSMLPSEAVMLERFKLGRTSLREALRILELHGLITMKVGPGGGPVVVRATSEDFGRMSTLHYQNIGATFRDLVEARIVIEPMMAAIAAEERDPDLIKRLKEIVSVTVPVTDNAYEHRVHDFHSVLAGTSGNPVLDLFGQSLRDVYNARVSATLLAVDTREQVLREHKAIVKAITNGDVEAARRLTKRHMESLMATVSKLFPGLLNEVVSWH